MMDAEPGTEIERGERLKVLRAVEALLRIQRLVIDHFPDEDMGTVAVFLTVAAGSLSVVHRNNTAYEQMMDGPLPREWFRPISGRAVAASCGLARESVRRRLEYLEKIGEIERVEGGYQLCYDVLSRGQNLAFSRGLVREFEHVHRMMAR
ncbi:MAG: hypothetical protein J0L52_02460 [Caulobacterales bacterium]|nr:hypothetical protein [Caulobacterales bacterium]